MSKTKKHYMAVQGTDELDVTDPKDTGLEIPDEVYEEATARGLSTKALLHEMAERGFVVDWQTSKAITNTLTIMEQMKQDIDKMMERLK